VTRATTKSKGPNSSAVRNNLIFERIFPPYVGLAVWRPPLAQLPFLCLEKIHENNEKILLMSVIVALCEEDIVALCEEHKVPEKKLICDVFGDVQDHDVSNKIICAKMCKDLLPSL